MSLQLQALAGPALAFAACAGVATYAQNLTGFAFSLILLGLCSVLHVASINDAANAASVLSLVNAWAYLRGHPAHNPWHLLRPILNGSVVGVLGGLMLLAWLSGSAMDALRGLLGLAILVCALLFMLQTRPRAQLSGRASFTFVGVLSGLLGGLFSSGGPPLVFHMYRQPLGADVIRRVLLLSFALGGLVRLAVVLPTGQFSLQAALLTAAAFPSVYLVSRFHRWLPHEFEPRTLKALVGGLLCLAGGTLLFGAWQALSAA
ncbi:TSUP family transporter [Xenophilus arseniciresistens]|uniref:Probable membrane transporter protein n=1 Tax=Xenophilus arseniciresistens TaxID=1283306 RepID=A0AAE3NA29_9BURK|nr:TSUP family transporter [Xenophilus arseniciresistens]MDA7417856.1 TSUP family transporter [Xenophilus arseniciresistens]